MDTTFSMIEWSKTNSWQFSNQLSHKLYIPTHTLTKDTMCLTRTIYTHNSYDFPGQPQKESAFSMRKSFILRHFGAEVVVFCCFAWNEVLIGWIIGNLILNVFIVFNFCFINYPQNQYNAWKLCRKMRNNYWNGLEFFGEF